MEMLWENGPQFVREMLTCYPDPKPHVNTVSTTVRIARLRQRPGHLGPGVLLPFAVDQTAALPLLLREKAHLLHPGQTRQGGLHRRPAALGRDPQRDPCREPGAELVRRTGGYQVPLREDQHLAAHRLQDRKSVV